MSGSYSIFSRLFYSWVGPFIDRNTKTPLVLETLLELPAGTASRRDADLLLAALKEQHAGRFALHLALAHCFRWQFLQIFGISMLMLVAGLATPLILKELITALEHKVIVAPGWLANCSHALGIPLASIYPILCSLGLFLVTLISLLSVHHLFYTQIMLSVRALQALRTIIYEKSSRLARSERSAAPSGFIINLVGTDATKVQWFLQFVYAIWYHPIQIVCAFYLLYRFVGICALYGASALLLFMLAAAAILKYQTGIKRRIMKISDQRVSLTNEVLTHIKAVKFQAWERQLSARISALRAQEIELLKLSNLLSSLGGLLSNLAPTIALLITLGSYSSLGGTLDASLVFPTMSLFMLLRFALNTLPDSVLNLLEALIALARMRSFLARKEFTKRLITMDTSAALRIHNATFEWAPGEVAVKVPELTIQKGELIAIVGGVGSGKSALCLGLLNEIACAQGIVEVAGTLGYVAQQPWIVSDSIRDNIVCGLPFNDPLYQRALQASCLGPDLKLLPHGDSTEIGERGINLSGGQRQRIALARALYGGADIYLLDDPLSALDSRVANQVFDLLICGEMLGTTRLLVTHRIEYALRADRIVVIEEGCIVECSSPKELQVEGTRFHKLLSFHSELTKEASSTLREHGTSHISEEPSFTEAPEEHKYESDAPSRSIIEQEEHQVGAVNWALVWEYLHRFAPGFVALSVLSFVIGRHLASLGTDLWLAKFSNEGVSSLALFLGGYCGFVIVFSLLHFMRTFLFLHRGLVAGRDSHDRLISGILAAPLRFFEATPVGRILNRFSRDLDTIESRLPRSILEAIHCFLDVLVVIGILVVLQPIALVIILPIFYAYNKLLRLFRPSAREAQRLDSISNSPIFALVSESLNGIETLRTGSLATIFLRRFAGYLDINTRAARSITAANRWLGIRLEFLAAVVILAAGISVSLQVNSGLSSAIAGLLLTYAISITGSMNWFVRSLAGVESNLTSFERINTYSHTPSERVHGDLAPPGWPSKGELRFVNLSVKYREELLPALSKVTCHIPGGLRVGIVGRTGSGKSTLILALARLIEPSGGQIEIDGVNLSTLSLEALRSAITVVPQEPVLFSGTLRDALDPFQRSSDGAIMEALARVELTGFIAELSKGLGTEVHENGANFSSGQRQLICLARALLRNSRVIILDEATANIDLETDYAIQRTIRREFSGATVLVVAHRLGTVLDSDLMLVLDAGRLGEIGAPADLLTKRGSLLAALVNEMRQCL